MSCARLLCVALLLAARWGTASDAPALIPTPESVRMGRGAVVVGAGSRVLFRQDPLARLAEILAGDVERTHHVRLATGRAEAAKPGDILLQLVEADPKLEPPGAYRLAVDRSVLLEAADHQSLALGMMTIVQALRREGGGLAIPRMTVVDRPSSAFRALQVCIKVGYHEPAWVKRAIDLARFYKVGCLMLHTAESMWIGCTLDSTAGVPEADRRRHLLWTKAEMDDVIAYGRDRGVLLYPHNETTPGFAGMRKALTTDFNTADRFAGYMDEIDGKGPYAPEKSIPDEADPRFWSFIREVTLRSCNQFAAGWPGRALGYYHMGPVYGEGGTRPANAVRILGFLKERNPAIRLMYWNGPAAKDPVLAPHRENLLVAFYSRDWGGSPETLVDAGYRLVNASWSPLYILPGYQRSPREIFEDFNVHRFGAGPHRAGGYHKVHWDLLPAEKARDRVAGALLPTWEFARQEGHLELIVPRIPFFAENVWHWRPYPHEAGAWERVAATCDALQPTALQFVREPRPPSAPAAVSATQDVHRDRVELVWAASDNYPEHYQVLRGEQADLVAAQVVADRVAATRFTDRTVPKGVSCHYWVRSVNPYGVSAAGRPVVGRAGEGVVLPAAAEPFGYEAGAALDKLNGGAGWKGCWEVASANGTATINDAGLAYPGLPVSGRSLRLHPVDKDETNRRRPPSVKLVRPLDRAFGHPATETWFSALLRAEKLAVGGLFFRLGTRGIGMGKTWGRGFAINNTGGRIAMEEGKTYFVVVCCTFRNGNERVRLWVNPTPGTQPGDGEVAAVSEQLQVLPENHFTIQLEPYGLGIYDIDEVRVGASYDAVAPRVEQGVGPASAFDRAARAE